METWVYETLFAAKNIDHFEVASELVDFRVEPLVDQDIVEYSLSRPLTDAKVVETMNSPWVFTKGFDWIT